jgi:peptide methionine sulfoxide reductase MsrB
MSATHIGFVFTDENESRNSLRWDGGHNSLGLRPSNVST